MSASGVSILVRVLAVEQVLAFKQIPDLIIELACFFIKPRIWLTDQAPNVPNINTVAPRCLQAHFWRPIDIWLHIFIMLDISRNSRAKIA